MNNILERARLLEEATAEFINGNVVYRSGAGLAKGDAVSKYFLAEAKYRSNESKKNSFSLRMNWLVTIYNQASQVSKEPLLALEWESGDRAFIAQRILLDEVETEQTLICNGESIALCNYEKPRLLLTPNIDIPAHRRVWTILSWDLFSSHLSSYLEPEISAKKVDRDCPERQSKTATTWKINRGMQASVGFSKRH